MGVSQNQNCIRIVTACPTSRKYTLSVPRNVAEAHGEDHQQRDDREWRASATHPGNRPVTTRKRHENAEGDGEVDQRRQDDDHREARLGKARLLQQIAVLDEHAGVALHDLDEQTPREHARAQEDPVTVDVTDPGQPRAHHLREDHREDDDVADRADQIPDEAQRRSAGSHLELARDARRHESTVPPQRLQHSYGGHDDESAIGRRAHCRPERRCKSASTIMPISCVERRLRRPAQLFAAPSPGRRTARRPPPAAAELGVDDDVIARSPDPRVRRQCGTCRARSC